MKKILKNIYKLTIAILFINIIFSFLLLIWVSDDDIFGLPSNILDRYITLFYYGMSILSTTGYGDIYAKSSRIKLIVSLYMILIMSGLISLLLSYY